MLLFVDLGELGGEIRGVAVAEFLDGVHTGGLEQLGELRADALDAEQVGVIDPATSLIISSSLPSYFSFRFFVSKSKVASVL